MRFLLPHTDAGAFVQLLVVLAVGLVSLVALVRRGAVQVAWLVGGIMMMVIGFFALRTIH